MDLQVDGAASRPRHAVGIIGAGVMGAGIAQIFAAHGCPVRVCGRNLERLAQVKDRIGNRLLQMAEYGLAESSEIPAVLARVEVMADLEAACEGAAFIIESIAEDLPVKQAIFARLDRICAPDTILCSNTSVLRITEIGALSLHRERILGTHFYQPAFLMPLVEVVPGEQTSPLHMNRAIEFLREAGKVPIRVNKDSAGFVANRMQHALWREAFAIVDEGVCDPETIDIAVKNSFGLRLPVLGPMEHADLSGLDFTLGVHEYLLRHRSAPAGPSSSLRACVERGDLGFRTGRGFFEWTEESIAEVHRRLLVYLLEFMRHADS